MTEAEVKDGEKSKEVEKTQNGDKKTEVEKPDLDAYNVKLNEISVSIDEIKKKIDGLQKEIKIANKAKEEYNKQRKEIVNKIDSLQNAIDKSENERRSVLEEIEKKQKHKRELKSSAQNMKKQIGFENEEDIENKIKEIENKLMTSTISIKEEKNLVNQIQLLNKNKPLLSSYSKIENEANKVNDQAIAPLKNKMDTIREQIVKLRNEKKLERNKLKELQNGFQEKNNKLNELNNLRDNYSKKMNSYFMERRNITSEMEKKKQQYRDYRLNLLQAKQQRIKEERERKNLEYEKQNLEKEIEDIDLLPYREELALIENMLVYLKRIQEEWKAEEQKKQQNSIKKINGEVEVAENENMKNENTKNENMKNENTKNENKKTKNKKEKQRQKQFKLDMNILCYFVTTGIDPPVSFDEVDSCIQKLNEKKKMYEEKRDESVKNVEVRRHDLTSKLKEIDDKLSNFKPHEPVRHNKANKVKA